MDVAQGIKSLSNFLFFCCSITPFSGKESMGQGMSFFSLSRSCLYPSLLWLTVLPFFFRCLAHFPPADTYESRGDAADVSCVLSTFQFLILFCYVTITCLWRDCGVTSTWSDFSDRNYLCYWKLFSLLHPRSPVLLQEISPAFNKSPFLTALCLKEMKSCLLCVARL